MCPKRKKMSCSGSPIIFSRVMGENIKLHKLRSLFLQVNPLSWINIQLIQTPSSLLEVFVVSLKSFSVPLFLKLVSGPILHANDFRMWMTLDEVPGPGVLLWIWQFPMWSGALAWVLPLSILPWCSLSRARHVGCHVGLAASLPLSAWEAFSSHGHRFQPWASSAPLVILTSTERGHDNLCKEYR